MLHYAIFIIAIATIIIMRGHKPFFTLKFPKQIFLFCNVIAKCNNYQHIHHKGITEKQQ